MNNIENEELLEIDLLSKNDLIDYDLERTLYMVLKTMKKYKRLRCKNYSEPPIKITTKYKYIYVDESAQSKNAYTKLDEYIDSKTEFKILSQKISMVTEIMTEEEKAYFTIAIYNGKSDTTAFKEIGCSNKGLIPIKNSCIVKFACAFDIEVYKGDTLNEEDEIKFLELQKSR